MNWRRWNRALHRDLGYLCFGLTLVYAVSGVALNHVHEWNPNYRIERVETRVGELSGVPLEAQAQEVLSRLGSTRRSRASSGPTRTRCRCSSGTGC